MHYILTDCHALVMFLKHSRKLYHEEAGFSGVQCRVVEVVGHGTYSSFTMFSLIAVMLLRGEYFVL